MSAAIGLSLNADDALVAPAAKGCEMSWQAQKWAWKQEGYSSSQKLVLLCFANHADDRGYTWPGTDTIAFECGLNEKTVTGAIQAIFVRRGIRLAKRRVAEKRVA
jgi:helix-turn-helix protein